MDDHCGAVPLPQYLWRYVLCMYTTTDRLIQYVSDTRVFSQKARGL